MDQTPETSQAGTAAYYHERAEFYLSQGWEHMAKWCRETAERIEKQERMRGPRVRVSK